jgi:hypothetical protein
MKNFFDLTDEEILNLTKDEIQNYIDLECAKNGIKLTPQPKKPEKNIPAPDVNVYTIGGFKTLNYDKALAVFNLVSDMDLVDVDYGRDFNYKFVTEPKSYTKPEITTDKYYSEESYKQIEDDIKKYEDAVKQYEMLMEDFEANQERRNEVADSILEVVYAAREKEFERQFLENQFNRYLELAENDRGTALRFLFDAHPEAENHKQFESEVK